MDVLRIRALVFGVYIKTPDVWKLPKLNGPGSGDLVSRLSNVPSGASDGFSWGLTLPQINMEANRGPYIEDSSLQGGSSQLPC